MRRFRLRYRTTDLDLPKGVFVVGRSGECNLALDDALVSRKHIAVHVNDEGAEVEDLKSRNGVLINGERVKDRRALRHLDRIMVGSEELILLEVSSLREGHATGTILYCENCRTPITGNETTCPTCGAATAGASGQTMEMRSPMKARPPSPSEDVPTSQQTALALLAGIANKALAMGRVDEAERLLAAPLAEIMQKARDGKSIAETTLTDGTNYALRLAEMSGKTRWIDWVFEVHEATAQLLPATHIDSLYTLVRRTRYASSSVLRAYVQTMQAKAKTFTPNERFLLQRLEGLERVAGA